MSYRILVVCSGNTCRSPMAKVLLQDSIARAELDIEVDSAGTRGIQAGEPMDMRAVKALSEVGVFASAHKARQVTMADLASADLVIPMTTAHVETLKVLVPVSVRMPNIRLLRSFDPESARPATINDSIDIADPYFGTQDDYRKCMNQIMAAIPGVLEYVDAELSQSH